MRSGALDGDGLFVEKISETVAKLSFQNDKHMRRTGIRGWIRMCHDDALIVRRSRSGFRSGGVILF